MVFCSFVNPNIFCKNLKMLILFTKISELSRKKDVFYVYVLYNNNNNSLQNTFVGLYSPEADLEV